MLEGHTSEVFVCQWNPNPATPLLASGSVYAASFERASEVLLCDLPVLAEHYRSSGRARLPVYGVHCMLDERRYRSRVAASG